MKQYPFLCNKGPKYSWPAARKAKHALNLFSLISQWFPV